MTLIGGGLLVLVALGLAGLALGLAYFGLQSARRLRRSGAARLSVQDTPALLAVVLPWLAVSVFCGLAAWRLLEMAVALAA